MTTLTFTFSEALQDIGISREKAQAMAELLDESIIQSMDSRYAIHSRMLATQGDVEKLRADMEKMRGELKAEIANAKVEIIKWNLAAILAAVGLAVAIIKLIN
ncbi:MAG: hypothetical protein FWH15_00195 [Betaproteobacteria bacterium]|nr:hypothetical protein [Betaproteobacteria bacterium]